MLGVHVIAINEGADVWITCQVDSWRRLSVTGGVYSECAWPHPSVAGWLTGWFSGCLTDIHCKKMLIYIYINSFICAMCRFFDLLVLIWRFTKKKCSLSGLCFPHKEKSMDIHHGLRCLFPSICLFPFPVPSLSFCISLAGRCYQCSYCQGWKIRGSHEPPWQ